MKRLTFPVAVIMGVLLVSPSFSIVWADTIVSLTKDNTDPQTATDFIDLAVTGADMIGMGVTVFFGDGTSGSQNWERIGLTSGAATGQNWALVHAGNTKLNSPWTITNTSSQVITGLTINGISGNTVFDIIPDEKGTEASGFGSAFSLFSPVNNRTPLDIAVTLSKPVGFQGASLSPDDQDLFGELAIGFLNGTELAPNDNFAFSIDTDRFRFPVPPTLIPDSPDNDGDSGSGGPNKNPTPNPNNPPPGSVPVPEPSTFLLMSVGFLAIVFGKAAKSRLKSH